MDSLSGGGITYFSKSSSNNKVSVDATSLADRFVCKHCSCNHVLLFTLTSSLYEFVEVTRSRVRITSAVKLAESRSTADPVPLLESANEKLSKD